MTADSHDAPAPLAEAILTWSDPALLEAVKAAEANFAAEDLERAGRDPLATLLVRRMRPRRGRPVNLAGNPYRPLDQAWDRVLDAFRLMIERGEVHLLGRQMAPAVSDRVEPLPVAWATGLDFDIRGAAVFFRERAFVAVTAGRGPAPVAFAALDGAETRPLAEALTHWTNPSLVAAVRAEERKYTPFDVHGFYRLADRRLQLSADDELRQPSPNAGWAGPPSMEGLVAAWRTLERDLRDRLVRGEFHLVGVRSAPMRETAHTPLPGLWAADFDFNFAFDRVKVGGDAWVAIVAVRGPEPAVPAAGAKGLATAVATAERMLPTITAATVRELTDDEVVELLEDHARRVVERVDAKLLTATTIKVSMVPIILRKLEHRAAAGEMQSTLAAEATDLAAWIRSKVPSHQAPTAGALKNALRQDYKRLKA